jgi:RNA polymerase-binding transcription factor DksA
MTATNFGICTHCGNAPAVETNAEGTTRLCAECAALRKNEAWNLPTGTHQEGENCERFQGDAE